jgi:hypothetical protein
MFTVKLYREGRLRVLAALSFTVVEDCDAVKQITLHRGDSVDDECFWIGSVIDARSHVDGHRLYDRAIVENANGKTTEMIFASPRGTPQRAA